MLQLFESWAGELNPAMFSEFCAKYLKQIAEGVREKLKAEGIEPVPIVRVSDHPSY